MENEDSETNNDHIFAFLEILRILSKTENFQDWLSNYHKIDDQQEFLEGYKYILTVSLMYFVTQLISHDPFSLKDDEKLIRADFLGVTIDNIPNSCEKIIVLKNIWRQSKKIRRARTFEEIQSAEPYNILKAYEALRETNLKANKEISKEESLSSIAQFYAYLLLVDTSFGMPRATKWASIFEPDESLKYLDTVFNGYRYALEYLWFCLLGPEKFQQFCVKDLHRSDEIHFDNENNTIKIKLGKGDDSGIEEYSESEEERVRKEEWDRIHDKWRTIDQFFGKLRSEMIRPLEAKIGRLGGFGKGFVRLDNFEKDMLGDLITNPAEDAPYMINTDEESLKKRIESELLWYPISVLNSAKTFTFNGAFSFVAMLRGLVNIVREGDNEGKILVQIFKHPALGVKKGNDYSFGIKVGVGSAISDTSGWLIFHDCATDYSGSGGHDYEMCINEIEKHKQVNAVEIKEQIFEGELFTKFLADKGISMDYEKSRKLYEKMNESFSKIKGKLLEYLVYKWINSKVEFETVQCDIVVNNEQIDCFCKSGNKIEHFECKLQLHNVQDTIKQIKRKHSKIKQEYPNHIVNANLILYATITTEVKKQLEDQGIRVHQDFKSNIQNERIFDGTRRELNSHFNSNLDY